MCLAFGLALSPPAAAESLEQLASAARTESITAQTAALNERIARHQQGQATAWVLPRISVSDYYQARFLNTEPLDIDCDVTVDPGCMAFVLLGDQIASAVDIDRVHLQSLSMSASQPLISVDAVIGILRQKSAGRLSALRDVGDRERLLSEVASHYATLQYDLELRAIYARSLARAEEMEEVMTSRHAAGEATDLELAQAQSDRAAARLSYDQLVASLPAVVEEVALLTGREPLSSVRVCPFGAPPDRGEPLDVSGATSLEAGREQLRLDQLNRTSSRLAPVPSVTLLGGGQTAGEMAEDFGYDNWYAGGYLSMTLFNGLGTLHAARASTLTVQSSEMSLDYDRRSLELDDRQGASQLSDLAAQVEQVRVDVALAERDAEATRIRYLEGGEGSYEVVNMANKQLEASHRQLAMLQLAQLEGASLRWARAGHIEALLERLVATDSESAAAGRCEEVSR